MKKYIILAVNENPQYFYFLPLTVWAWRKFGWEPILLYAGSAKINEIIELSFSKLQYYQLEGIYGYRSDTISQVSRLYPACILNGYLMTGDIDMIPLSDYWKPDENEITTWGHDLTAYQHYPICYIGMPHTKWVEVMSLNSSNYNKLIKRDLDLLPQARSADSVKRWVTDQDLITERLNDTQFKKISIERGSYKNGYPIGRVDRSAWTLNHEVFIDAHLPHDILTNQSSFNKVFELLEKIWPEENFDWFVEYTEKFKELNK